MTDKKHEHSPQHEELLAQQALQQHEVMEVLEFIKKYAKPAAIVIGALLAVFLVDSFIKSKNATEAAKADLQLLKAQTSDQFQAVVDNFGSTPAKKVAMLGLAREYYNAGNYDEAEKLYETFTKKHARHEMAPLAELNLIACKEARGQLGDAHTLYGSFADENNESYLAPVAKIGQARCLEALGQFADAKAAYEDVLMLYPSESWADVAHASLQLLKNK